MAFVHVFRPGTSGRTVLALHGTGGDERSLLEFAAELSPGDAVLSPRGDVIEAGAARWFRRFSEGVFDEDDMAERSGRLAAFVREAAGEHGFDAGNVVAFGYSNGANMAAALMLLHPTLLRGAAMWRAMLPLRRFFPGLPTPSLDLSGREALVLAGQADPFAPLDRAQALADRLTESGARVRFEATGPSHGVVPEDARVTREWFAGLQSS